MLPDVSDSSTTLSTLEERPPTGPRGVALPLPCLTVVHHPDLRRIGERVFVRPARGAAFEVSRTGPRFAHPGTSSSQALDDPYLSRAPLRLAPRGGHFELTTDNPKVKVEGRPLTGRTAIELARLDRGVTIELAKRVVLLFHLAVPGQEAEAHGMLGASAGLRAVQRAVGQVADVDVPVLIRGETGVGKDHVARAIHAASCASGPYVALNMATIERSTAASELFGHVRGAFTGASQDHVGLFGRARGGTLFLDEIGELDLDVQGMLLRTLESGSIRPLGATEEIPCPVRVIAATDADLDAMVSASAFRPALLHRLDALSIEVPPLRERREDIPRLLVAFLEEEMAELGSADRLERRDPKARAWLPAELMLTVLDAPWPGNVRQLRNVVRRIAVASRGAGRAVIDMEALRKMDRASPPPPASPSEDLASVLERHGWSLSAAAQELGLSRAAMYRRVAEHPELRTGADLSRDELAEAMATWGGDLAAVSAALRVSRRAVKRQLKALGLV